MFLQVIIVVTCCLRNCDEKGIHRVKLYISDQNPIYDVRKIPRVCEVFFKENYNKEFCHVPIEEFGGSTGT